MCGQNKKEFEMFNALIVSKDEESGKTSASVTQIGLDDLPHGDVTVAVEYSTVNYKDGLCVGPGGGLVRKYPHVPGIDFADSASIDLYFIPKAGGCTIIAVSIPSS